MVERRPLRPPACSGSTPQVRARGLSSGHSWKNGLRSLNELLGQVDVRLAAARANVVENNRFAERRGFTEPDVSRNHGAVDLVAEVLPNLLGDLAGEVHPLVVH